MAEVVLLGISCFLPSCFFLFFFTIQSVLSSFNLLPSQSSQASPFLHLTTQSGLYIRIMGRPEDKILSYNDVALRRSDLDILSGPHFINDRIIEFYFSYISSTLSNKVLLVPPSISFWIMNCPVEESLKDFLEPLHLNDMELVLFPVNDNDDVTLAESGSHWSLLAFDRMHNLFVHHDSNRGINNRYAKRLYNVLVRSMSDSNAGYVEWRESPQQVNGYDCGLYVIVIARAICSWYVQSEVENGNDLWFPYVKEEITPSLVGGLRNEILEVIRSLMAAK